MLPPQHRLRLAADFSAAIRSPGGARSGSRLLVVHAHQAGARAGHPQRVGFVVSKAVGNAVVRGRVKRRLRAQVAARLDLVPAGTDLVIRANPVAAEADSSELGRELDRVLVKVVRRLEPAVAVDGGTRA